MMKIWTAAVALTLAVALLACGTGDGGSPTAGPEENPTLEPITPTPPAGATPVVIGGVEALPLTFGETVELPADVAIIVERGCYNCDGPPIGLLRVYRDGAGHIRRDTLLTVEGLGVYGRAVQSADGVREERPYIVSYVLSADISQAVVGVCTRGSCVELGGPPSPDAETTLFSSLDGGVTWREGITFQGSAAPLAISSDGVLLARSTADRPEVRYEMFPSGESVSPPPAAGLWPLPLPDGELLWPTNDNRILRSDGSLFLSIDQDSALEYQVASLTADPAGNALLFMVVERGRTDTFRERFFLLNADSSGRVLYVFSTEFLSWLGAWLDSDLVLGNADPFTDSIPEIEPGRLTGPVPVLLDIGARSVHPMVRPFIDEDFPKGRNFLIGVINGPFARVVDTGSCLNVRVEAGANGRVLDCAADGVLLRDAGEEREVEDVTWLRVVTPAGVEGWASTAYLER